MKTNSFEDMFNFMKGLGHYQDCATYQEYREKHLGITKTPDELKEEEHNKEYQDFKNEMSQEEREQYEECFSESLDTIS
jgi:hypothetical protein